MTSLTLPEQGKPMQPGSGMFVVEFYPTSTLHPRVNIVLCDDSRWYHSSNMVVPPVQLNGEPDSLSLRTKAGATSQLQGLSFINCKWSSHRDWHSYITRTTQRVCHIEGATFHKPTEVTTIQLKIMVPKSTDTYLHIEVQESDCQI